jgi:hypothetical protein
MIWFFERGIEQMTCEVRRRAAAYEIATWAADGTRTVRVAHSPAQLLEEMETLPQSLLRDGWQPVARYLLDRNALQSSRGARSVSAPPLTRR